MAARRVRVHGHGDAFIKSTKARKTTPPVARRPPKKKAAFVVPRRGSKTRSAKSVLVRCASVRPGTRPRPRRGAWRDAARRARSPRAARSDASVGGAPSRILSGRATSSDVAPRHHRLLLCGRGPAKISASSSPRALLVPALNETAHRYVTSPLAATARRIALQVRRTVSCKKQVHSIDCESKRE